MSKDDFFDDFNREFADLTPQERMHEIHLMNSDLIREGVIVAIRVIDGDILYKHVEHCTDAELAAQMSISDYETFIEEKRP